MGTAKKALVALMAALLVLMALTPMTAFAQEAATEPAVNAPPAAPKAPAIFPERDFVEVGNEGVGTGYPPDTDVKISVKRTAEDGSEVVVGTAQGTTDGTGALEVNHPGGVCWVGVTPDILPNDKVYIEYTADNVKVTDRIDTLDVIAEPAYIEDGKLIVKGTARNADGSAMMDFGNIEQRIINPDFNETEVDRRDISVTGSGEFRLPAGASATFVRDTPGSPNWTVTYTGLSQNVMDLAVAGQTRVLSWMKTDANGNRLGLTIFEAGEVGGPGFGGCPAGAEYAVKSSDPGSVNSHNVGQDLVLSGASHNASSVSVTLDDESTTTEPLTAGATPGGNGAQTWSVNFPHADVANLSDGTLTAKATYTVEGGTIGGRNLSILKDVIVPQAPKASPDAGTYTESQSVTLSNPSAGEGNPDPAAKIHYTVNGTRPTAESRVYTNPIKVTADQTIKAAAVDAAGNTSPVAPFAYNVGSTASPAADPVLRPFPADGTPVVNTPAKLPHDVVLFPERDFVVAEGFDPNTPLNIKVIRNGVTVGTAQGTTDHTGFVEVNHPGGVCWQGVTPDLRPGDRVEVTDAAGNGDASTTINVTAQAAQKMPNGDIVVHGTAQQLDEFGNAERIPVERLEQRIINPDFNETEVGRRDISRTPTYDNPYDPNDPNRFDWTVTYTGLSTDAQAAAVAGQTRILSWLATDAAANRLGITIFEVGEVGGPGFGGCPNGADYAVAASDHNPAINSHNVGKDLVLFGVSEDASEISVSLNDEDAATAAVTADVLSADLSSARGAQTWSVTLPATSVAGLKDGTLTAKATYKLADETSVSNGVSLNILKDTDAPAAPAGTPGAGTYSRTQSVTLDTNDPTARILHTLDGAPLKSTTPGSTNPQPIVVEKTQTINAAAIDPAGNKSQVSSLRYAIEAQAPPPAPSNPDLEAASDSGASNADDVTNDTTPTFVGTAEAGSTVKILVDGVEKGSGTATGGNYSVTLDGPLGDGGYAVTATASNAAGASAPTTPALGLKIDATAPVAKAPDKSFPLRQLSSSGTKTVPVGISWGLAGVDSGSPLVGYQLQQSTNNGAYANVTLAQATATGVARELAADNQTSYRFRVRATDLAGNQGAFAEQPASFRVRADQESSTAITYAGSWTSPQNLNGAYGGKVRSSSTAGASATLSGFIGSNVALVSTTGPNRGMVRVCIDSSCEVVDLYSATVQPRKVVFSKAITPGTHTISVTVLSTKNASSTGTRVDIDAFLRTS